MYELRTGPRYFSNFYFRLLLSISPVHCPLVANDCLSMSEEVKNSLEHLLLYSGPKKPTPSTCPLQPYFPI